MKKYLSIILIILLSVSLSACGKNNSTNTNVSKEVQEKNTVNDNNNSNIDDKKEQEDKVKKEQEEKEKEKKEQEEKAKKEQEEKEEEAKRIESYERGCIDNPEKFDEMFNIVKKLVAEDNREKVAEYILYPINHNMDNTGIRTKEDFIKNYDNLFTEKVKKILADTSVKELYGHPYYGIIVGDDQIRIHEDGIWAINNEYDGSFDCDNEIVIELDYLGENFNEDIVINEALSHAVDGIYRLLVKESIEKDELSVLHCGLLGTMFNLMGDGARFEEIYINYYYDEVSDILKNEFTSVYEFMKELPKRVSQNENTNKDDNILDNILLFSENINSDFKNNVIDKFSKIEYEYLQGLMNKGFKLKFQTPNSAMNSGNKSNNMSLVDGKIISALGMNEEEIISILGEPSFRTNEVFDQISYDDLGLRFIFQYKNDNRVVDSISFKNGIGGVTMDMSYSEIVDILGTPLTEDVMPSDGITYLMTYDFAGKTLVCYLSSKDGVVYNIMVTSGSVLILD
ncbi:hypothetical protein [Oceanirhabdus seepicola]|uniref:Uncharacterized protein n=1 Tax=Oceanirhabdus seepicola TaxID=2828781 RepID=A0A9J6NZH3_9CLOT|nr:hypothetical protein [Oceanirhabdus seepicola]MCM1989943.1 hypothetical protein [Oceanirhabdus seepicola]